MPTFNEPVPLTDIFEGIIAYASNHEGSHIEAIEFGWRVIRSDNEVVRWDFVQLSVLQDSVYITPNRYLQGAIQHEVSYHGGRERIATLLQASLSEGLFRRHLFARRLNLLRSGALEEEVIPPQRPFLNEDTSELVSLEEAPSNPSQPSTRRTRLESSYEVPLDAILREIIQYLASLEDTVIEPYNLFVNGRRYCGWRVINADQTRDWGYTPAELQRLAGGLYPGVNTQGGRFRIADSLVELARARRARVLANLPEEPEDPKLEQDSIWQALLKDD